MLTKTRRIRAKHVRTVLEIDAAELAKYEAIIKSGQNMLNDHTRACNCDTTSCKQWKVEFGRENGGYKVEIRVVNSRTGPYVDSSIFTEYGDYIGSCEPGESIAGEHIFYVPDQDGKDDEYTVVVRGV